MKKSVVSYLFFFFHPFYPCNPRFVLFASFLLPAVSGCLGARVVRETPDGGVISVPMNSNSWPMYYRSRAEKLMSDKCPGGYRIEREEYVFNGKPGTQGHRPYESYFGFTDPDDETAPYLRKEYWIAFHADSRADRQAATNTTPQAGRSAPSASLSSPPGEDKDELPPPRPLPEAQK